MNLFRNLVSAFALASIASSPLQAQTIADVPTSLSGTYDMVLDFLGNNPGSFPHKLNDKVRFVIDGTNDTLCMNGTLLPGKPQIFGNGIEITWTSNTNTFYSVVVVNGQLHEINSSQGQMSNFVGQFNGTKVSSATTCTAGSGTTTTTTPVTVSTDMQSVFDLAAELYPTLFKDGSALASYQGYIYRFFAGSKIYVGIKDNTIYLMGGQFGSAISPQGSVTNVLGALKTAKANLNKPTTPTTPIPTGLFTLTVSGQFTSSGLVSFSTPFSVTLPNMPAPAVTDTTVIIDQIRTQLGATGISNIKITSINNTASRVTFRVEFSATTGGLVVTYDLTYDYTK